jgi:UDP-N-acetylglucosamine--dolichyl-phosphate N-acetylglucosaminephosphotransferase
MLLAIALTLIAAFAVTFYFTPKIMRRMKARGIVGIDMNKISKPKIPEMGGITVMFGLSIGIAVAIFSFTYLKFFPALDLTLLLAGFLTVVLIAFIGIVDDLISWREGLTKWQHALFPMFAALPLMAVRAGTTVVALPIIREVHFGILYSLIIVPIGVSGAANAFNMLAGLNGLEAGLGIIAAMPLLAISIINGKIEAAILLAALIGALLAFLRYNWFPSKTFGGDSLTLMCGAAIAAASVIGDMEKIGVLVIFLFFIELLLKATSNFKGQSFGVPQKDGSLKPDKARHSLTHIVLSLGRFTEQQAVLMLLFLQALVSIGVFVVFLFKPWTII